MSTSMVRQARIAQSACERALTAYSRAAYDNGVNRASMLNNITYAPPETPSLMTMLSMGNDSLDAAAYGPQTAATVLRKFDVMDLLLINFDGGSAAPPRSPLFLTRSGLLAGNAHPFHLHGHTFQITRRQWRCRFERDWLRVPELIQFPRLASLSQARAMSLRATRSSIRRTLTMRRTRCAATRLSCPRVARSTSSGRLTIPELGSCT